jgi:hypothetical protein
VRRGKRRKNKDFFSDRGRRPTAKPAKASANA